MLSGSLFNQPVTDLSDDPFLCYFIGLHRLKTLSQLLRYSGAELLRMEGGSEHCLLAVYSLLRQHRCTHLWRED